MSEFRKKTKLVIKTLAETVMLLGSVQNGQSVVDATPVKSNRKKFICFRLPSVTENLRP